MASFKKKWEVLQRTQRDVPLVDTGKRKLRLGRNRALVISDAAEARHIQQGPQKNDLLVIPTDNYPVEQGHKYTFSMPAMPWAEYDALGRRVGGGNNGKTKSGEEKAKSGPIGQTSTREEKADRLRRGRKGRRELFRTTGRDDGLTRRDDERANEPGDGAAHDGEHGAQRLDPQRVNAHDQAALEGKAQDSKE